MIVKFKTHPIEFESGQKSAIYTDIKDGFDNLKSVLTDICDQADINTNDIKFYKALPNHETGKTSVYNRKEGKFKNVPDLSLAYIIRFSKAIDIEQAIMDMKGLADVQYAHQPVKIRPCDDEPNDPEYKAANQWYLDKIGATNARNIVHGSSSVKIAVVDGHGVKTNHEDLSSNYDGGETTYDATHGTQVAGVAAAVTNNNTGIASLSWNTKFRAYKVDLLEEDMEEVSSDIEAAADAGADVIVMSFATWKDTVVNTHTYVKANNFEIVEDAIDYAESSGAVLVASAGNDEPDNFWDGFPYPQWPAQYSNVLGVSATDSLDSFVVNYNYNDNGDEPINVAAPGKYIRTTTYSGSNDTYVYSNGTSLSAPIVASLAALIMSADPSLTPSEVRSVITLTADTVGQYNYVNGKNDYFGYGRINAYEAIRSLYNLVTIRNNFTGVAGYPGSIKVGGSTEDSPHEVYILKDENITVEAITQTYNGIKYTFDEWHDQSTTNPRTFSPTGDTIISASYNGKPVSPYYYDLQIVGDPYDPVGLIWDQHPNTNVAKYEIWRKVKHNGVMGSPVKIATNNSRSYTTHTDYEYNLTDGYTDDLLYYDVRAYYSTEQTYSDPEWIDAFGEEAAKRATEFVEGIIPDNYSISNYPNPFNPSTTISYSLIQDAHVTLAVYNISGQKVRELYKGHLKRGAYKSIWDGTSKSGKPVAGGIYISKLTIEPDFENRQVLTQKMLLAK